MFIPQDLADFVDNPMGRGSTVIMNRMQVRSYLNARYNTLISKFGDFKYTIYTDGNDSYFFHFIIPSESQRRNNYDVVIQFINSPFNDEDFSGANNIRNYYIKLFSNCPSFTYTYAYVYKEYDRGIPMLYDKFRDETLSSNPITRNPGEIISYEKSTYYACKFLLEHKMVLNKSHLSKFASTDIQKMVKNIRTTDTIMKEIDKENNRLKREKGNKGFVKLRKKTIKGSVYDTKVNKSAGVDKNTPAKNRIKQDRKAKAQSHIITPKPKIGAKSKIVSSKKHR